MSNIIINWSVTIITMISLLCCQNAVSKTLSANDRIDDPVKWYNFLESFHEKLSEYAIRRRVMANDFTEFHHKLDKTSKLHLSKLVKKLSIPHYDYLNKKKLTAVQREELLHVLSLTLTNKIESKCVGPNKVIRANYISLKELVEKANLTNDCDPKRGSVAVFALNTLFVDDDLRLPGQRVVFVALKWEVIGKHKVDLSGSRGANLSDDLQCDVASLGKSGDPGLPGGAGGVFFGIGQTFVNGHNLQIVANGGKGGPGGLGCHGAKGIDGDTASFDQDRDCESCQGDDCPVCQCFHDFGIDYFKNAFRELDVAVALSIRAEVCTHKIKGQPGQKGEKGGDGGKGGKGGNPGSVVLLEFNKTASKVVMHAKSGPDGDDGAGGEGGTGGNHGKDLVAGCDYHHVFHPCRVREFKGVNLVAPTGLKGTPGANDQGIKDPSRLEPIYNPSELISEYKSFVRENLIDYYFGSPRLIKFLRHLDNDHRVNSLYDLLGLFDELERLERQFYQLDVEESKVPFYKSLLDRVNEYSRVLNHKIKDPYELEKYRIPLKYLYAVIAQRLQELRLDFNSYSISNVEEYLYSLKVDVDNLMRYEADKNKIDVIDDRRRKYQADFELKIEEAKRLIDQDVNAKITRINREMDSEIEKLVESLATEIDQGKGEEKRLEKKQKRLEDTLTMRSIFHTIEFVGKTMELLGPYGAFAGGVISDADNIAEERYFGDDASVDDFYQISSKVLTHVEQANSQVASLMSNKVDGFNQVLDRAIEEIKENEKDFGSDVLHKITSIKERLNHIDPDNFNYLKVRALENEFNQELGSMKKRFKDNNVVEDKKTVSARVSKLVSKCQLLLNFGQEGSGLMEKFDADSKKLDAATDAVVAAQDDINGLEKYRNEIYTEMSPLIRGLQGRMNDLRKNLGSESKAALDVTQWKVQATLGKVKEQIHDLTRGQEMPARFNQSIYKLQGALGTLIRVYDDLQAYQSEENLAGLVADVGSVAGSDAIGTIGVTTDADLRKAMEQTEILVRSNMITKEFRVGMHAVKQFVFPFGCLYLKKVELPKSFRLARNLDSLVGKVVERIDFMADKLRRYKNSHSVFERSLGLGEFSSRFETTQPFFTWRNEEHRLDIRNLLMGKEVLLNADVAKSEVNVDAVKFRILTLELRVPRNATTRQSELDDLLKGFRVHMVHLGNSQYRFDNKTYAITTRQFNIWYNFERNSAGEPVQRSSEYEDITRGEFMLSPFAMWRMQLVNLGNKRNVSFEELKPFGDEVDLELSGVASYLARNSFDGSELKVDEYYKTTGKRNRGSSKEEDSVNKRSLVRKIYEVYQEPENENGKGQMKRFEDSSWFKKKLPDL